MICIECLEMYHKLDTSEEADIYVPITEEYFKQTLITGIDYGCLIYGYGPDNNQKSFYLIGDILLEMNGMKINTIDDLKTAKIENESNKVKVL